MWFKLIDSLIAAVWKWTESAKTPAQIATRAMLTFPLLFLVVLILLVGTYVPVIVGVIVMAKTDNFVFPFIGVVAFYLTYAWVATYRNAVVKQRKASQRW